MEGGGWMVEGGVQFVHFVLGFSSRWELKAIDTRSIGPLAIRARSIHSISEWTIPTTTASGGRGALQGYLAHKKHPPPEMDLGAVQECGGLGSLLARGQQLLIRGRHHSPCIRLRLQGYLAQKKTHPPRTLQ